MVMTKDDVPLLSRWLIYHGHLFGYEHLYVFDGSTGKQKAYLLWTAKHFPIHVHHRLVDLNSISKRLVAWMSEIKDRYQWIMKVDTDEFVAYAPGGKLDAASTSFHLPAGTTAVNLAVERVLHPEPVKSGSPTDSERGSIENLTWFKHIYSGPQFKASTFNLGSHCFNPTAPAPGLAIVHYPRSYDEMVRMATQVIISHKYIHATDNSSEIIRKLTKLSHKYTRPQCPISSCHKTWRVLDYLKDPDKMRSAYYLQHGKQPAILRDFRNYLREIFVLYPSLLQWAEPATANSTPTCTSGRCGKRRGGGGGPQISRTPSNPRPPNESNQFVCMVFLRTGTASFCKLFFPQRESKFRRDSSSAGCWVRVVVRWTLASSPTPSCDAPKK